jgi:hypothetical protein
MGKRFRDRRKPEAVSTVAVIDSEYVNHSNVGTLYQEPLVPYYDGEIAAYDVDQGFPVQYEEFQSGASGVAYNTSPVGSIKDDIDYEIGGASGMAGFAFPRSEGVTASDSVENFWLDGRQAVIRRKLDTNYGPVSTSDHNALVALAYAQSVNQYYPNEQSQFDVIRSI